VMLAEGEASQCIEGILSVSIAALCPALNCRQERIEPDFSLGTAFSGEERTAERTALGACEHSTVGLASRVVNAGTGLFTRGFVCRLALFLLCFLDFWILRHLCRPLLITGYVWRASRYVA
jgi:hypothetical protein